MNLKTLKERKSSFLSSNDSVKKEYGRAYSEIEGMYNRSSEPWLSEDCDISDIAIRYFNIQATEFKKDKKEFRKHRMNAATECIMKPLGIEEVRKIITTKGIKTFEEAKEQLRTHHQWTRIFPSTVKEILSGISDGDI
jgi:hypothetical protein